MTHFLHSFINLADPMIFNSFGGDEYWEKLEVDSGFRILNEGEESRDFYYILSGTVDVIKALEDGKGHQKVLARLQSGDIFGEGSLLSDKGRGASVVAASHSVLLKLSKKKFDRLVLSDPQAAVGITLGIVKVQNGRLANVNTRLLAMYKLSKLIVETHAELESLLPAALNEVKRVLPGDFALFNMEGLLVAASQSAQVESLQLKIPDFANRLAAKSAPSFLIDDSIVFISLSTIEGRLSAILAASVEEPLGDEDLQFLTSFTELLGHLF